MEPNTNTKTTLVCPEEPIYVVGVYGPVGLPEQDPPPAPPEPVQPPEPNYTEEIKIFDNWEHHGGSGHIADGKDSRDGASDVNNSFHVAYREKGERIKSK